MNSRRIVVAAAMDARDITRRRVAMVMLVALPLAFFASAASGTGSFVLAVGGIGVAWSVTGAGVFLALGSRKLASRLVLAGYRHGELVAGELAVLWTLAVPLVVLFSTVVIAVKHPQDPSAFVVAVALTALISAPLGLVLGALAPGELEGTLSLILIIGIQMSLPATVAAGVVLPLYGPTLLIEHAYGNSTAKGAAIAHAMITIALLTAAAFAFSARRTNVAR